MEMAIMKSVETILSLSLFGNLDNYVCERLPFHLRLKNDLLYIINYSQFLNQRPYKFAISAMWSSDSYLTTKFTSQTYYQILHCTSFNIQGQSLIPCLGQKFSSRPISSNTSKSGSVLALYSCRRAFTTRSVSSSLVTSFCWQPSQTPSFLGSMASISYPSLTIQLHYLRTLQTLYTVPHDRQLLLPSTFSSNTSSRNRMFNTPCSGNCRRQPYNCARVLGKPSSITPFAATPTFSRRMSSTTSSLTRPPVRTMLRILAINDSSYWAETGPFSILRISSPVEIWSKPRSRCSSLAQVPFPTPGAPKRSRYFWLGFTPEWKQLTFRTKSIIINHGLINLQHVRRKRCDGYWPACLKSERCFLLNSWGKYLPTMYLIAFKPILNIQMQIVLKTRSIELASIGQDQAASNPDQKDAPSNPNPRGQKVRIRQKCRKIIIGLIISLSALMFGYSLKEITSVPIKKIMEEYSITSVEALTAQSILIGILPIGSILGAIITKFLIKRFRRLVGIYIFTVVNIVAVILINITTFPTLIVGRFIEGVCIGYYCAIAPVYLKEIAPKELRKMLGLFFSFGKVVGVLVVIAMELIFDTLEVDLGWRVLLSMTAVFSLLQAVLIYFFGSDTPTEMIEKGQKEEAKKIIEEFYFKEYVDEVLHQYQQEYDAEQAKGKQSLSENSNEVCKVDIIDNQRNQTMELAAWQNDTIVDLNSSAPNNDMPVLPNQLKIIPHPREITDKKDKKAMKSQHPAHSKDNNQKTTSKKLTYDDKKGYAFCLCLHLCVIRHFTGGNAIISQGGLFVGYFNTTLGTYTALIINAIQFVFIVIGMVYIQKVIGKRPLFLFSITLLSFINIGVAISMIYEVVPAIQTLLCVYMMVYGGSFIAPIWAYPSEIVPASESLLPNIFHWVALALSTLIPPLVMKVMPHHNPYPVFIFFGLYGFLSLIHLMRYLRESDGLTYKEIIKSFR